MFSVGRHTRRAGIIGVLAAFAVLGVACSSNSDGSVRDRNVSSGQTAVPCSKAGEVKAIAGVRSICGQTTMAKNSAKQWFPVAQRKKWVCKKPGIPRFQNGVFSVCGTVKKEHFWHTVKKLQAATVSELAPTATTTASPSAQSTTAAPQSTAAALVPMPSGMGIAAMPTSTTTSTSTTLAPTPTTTAADAGPMTSTTARETTSTTTTTPLGPLEVAATFVPAAPRVGDAVWFGATAGCEVKQFMWRVDSAKFSPHSASATHQPFTPSQPETYKAIVYGTCDSGPNEGRVVSAKIDVPILAAARPTNDNIDNATILTGEEGLARGTSMGSTIEAGERKHTDCPWEADVSVWMKWTAPRAGSVAFTYTPQNPWRSGGLVFYSGDSFDTLERLVTSVSSDWRTQTFTAIRGVTYSIVSTGCYRGSFGAFTVDWTMTPTATTTTVTTTTVAPTTTAGSTTTVASNTTAAPSTSTTTTSTTATSTTAASTTTSTTSTTTPAPVTTTPTPARNLKVGDTGPGGGIVFLTPNSAGNATGKYFEASTAAWYGTFGCLRLAAPTQSIPVTRTQIGSAATNHTALQAACADWPTSAARIANSMTEGPEDWYLPTVDELHAMYDSMPGCSRCAKTFGKNNYWTSTIPDGGDPYIVVFGYAGGMVRTWPKDKGASIRAIRSFQ